MERKEMQNEACEAAREREDNDAREPVREAESLPMREDCERQSPVERATKAESCEGESRSSYRKLQIQLREAIAEKEAVEKKCDELRHVLDKACAQLEDNRQLLISAMEREDELIGIINGFTKLLSLGRITQKN